MKNRGALHGWEVSGEYDPALDGPDLWYGRREITCRVCGEVRRVWWRPGLDDLRLAAGCRRRGPDTPWRPGDLLVRDGAYLDEFVAWLPDGLVRTWNAGGRYHVSEPSALYPA